jgi:hypothetical protein
MSIISDELISYYQALLIIQYLKKPKAQGTISAFIDSLVSDAITIQVRDGFDLDTAIGKQLDFLGKLRNASRYFFTLVLTKIFIAIPSYDDPDKGLAAGIPDYSITPYPPSWYTMTYDDFIGHTLTDGDFRRVIKFLAKVHSCDHAYGMIDTICYEFFFGNVNLIDNGDMTIKYQHLTSDTDNLFSIVSQMGLLPKPAGVFVTTEEVPAF